MDIIKFNKFNEGLSSDYLLYYAFDWDDNLLNMTTVVHLEQLVNGEWKPIDISTSEFAKVRNDKNYRLLDNNADKAFSEFRDFGPRGQDAFLIDVKDAISKGRFGPAWDDFIECLTSGSLFAIITARGHESDTIRKGIEWIMDNVLTREQQDQMYNNLLKFAYLYKAKGEFDRILKGKPSQSPLIGLYLDECDLVGVSSPSRGGNPSNPEKAKEEALLEFKDKVNKFASNLGIKAKIGFSDDDVKNVKHIEDLVDSLSNERFPEIIQFTVKNTKDPKKILTKTRNMFEAAGTGFGSGGSTTPAGLESSVLTCTQFGNMTANLYPTDKDTRQDDYHNQMLRKTKYVSKMSKDIFKKKKKK